MLRKQRQQGPTIHRIMNQPCCRLAQDQLLYAMWNCSWNLRVWNGDNGTRHKSIQQWTSGSHKNTTINRNDHWFANCGATPSQYLHCTIKLNPELDKKRLATCKLIKLSAREWRGTTFYPHTHPTIKHFSHPHIASPHPYLILTAFVPIPSTSLHQPFPSPHHSCNKPSTYVNKHTYSNILFCF